MFNWLKRNPRRLQTFYRCLCGAEYERDMSREADGTGCPNCGRVIPAAISESGRPWKSYRQHQIDNRKAELSHKIWKKAAVDLREETRRLIERELRQFDDGSWADEYRRTIPELEKFVAAARASGYALGTPGLETPEATEHGFKLQIRKLKEELEAAGETP